MIDTSALSRGQIFSVDCSEDFFFWREADLVGRALFFGGERSERPRLEKFPPYAHRRK